MKSKGAVVLIVVIVILTVAGAWSLRSRQVEGSQIVSGTVEVDEVRVASRYGGRVEKILAQEGDLLRAGQLIAELDAAELRARRDYAVAALQELQSGARPEEIATAKFEWESKLTELELAKLEAERISKLFAEKTVTETERDRAVSRVRALEQVTAAMQERYNLLLAGARAERIAQAKAQLAEVEAQLREMQIVAPSDCVLEVLHVRVGDVLLPNQPVATLLLTQHLWVRVYVPELWLGKLSLGQSLRVRTNASAAKEFTGVIEQINRQAEFTPRNVQTTEDRIKQVFGVKIRLPAASGLRAGMSVEVLFPEMLPQPK